VLYPGKLTQVETFRVGCIGAIGPEEMRLAVDAVRDALDDMGVTQIAPAAPRRAAA
jgi:2-aminoethylphosphonate-pyruvate transaminase